MSETRRHHHIRRQPNKARSYFVKLHQFDPQDRTQVHEKIRSDIDVQPLFSDERETVNVKHWEPNSKNEIDAPGGLELLVLEGSVSESGDQLQKWDWLRLPPGARLV